MGRESVALHRLGRVLLPVGTGFFGRPRRVGGGVVVFKRRCVDGHALHIGVTRSMRSSGSTAHPMPCRARSPSRALWRPDGLTAEHHEQGTAFPVSTQQPISVPDPCRNEDASKEVPDGRTSTQRDTRRIGSIDPPVNREATAKGEKSDGSARFGASADRRDDDRIADLGQPVPSDRRCRMGPLLWLMTSRREDGSGPERAGGRIWRPYGHANLRPGRWPQTAGRLVAARPPRLTDFSLSRGGVLSPAVSQITTAGTDLGFWFVDPERLSDPQGQGQARRRPELGAGIGDVNGDGLGTEEQLPSDLSVR